MDKRIELIIEDIKKYCQSNGISVNMDSSAPRVRYSDPEKGIEIDCSGFFSDKNGLSLHVATGKPFMEWFPIFLHEFCHGVQCINQEKVWTDNQIDKKMEAGDLIDLYLKGLNNVSKEDALESKQKVMAVELDCEKKVVELIKKYQIQDIIDVKEYIQKSNAYVLFYHLVVEEKKWYKKTAPYENREIYGAMPDFFLEDYNTISENHYNVLKKTLL
jgi:hypothetical protein